MRQRPVQRSLVLGISALATISLLSGCSGGTTGATGSAAPASSAAVESSAAPSSAAPSETPTVVPTADTSAVPSPEATVSAAPADTEKADGVFKYGTSLTFDFGDSQTVDAVVTLESGVFKLVVINPEGHPTVDLSKAKLSIRSSDGTLIADKSSSAQFVGSSFSSPSTAVIPFADSTSGDAGTQVWFSPAPGDTGYAAWNVSGS